MFRRRRSRAGDDPDLLDEEPTEGTVDEAAADPVPEPDDRARPQGPWDSTDVSEDEQPRVDLGALRVPVPEGVEMRVDVQEQTVVAATLVHGNSAMQIHAFAAPRSSGIWREVCEEIAESIRSTGGSAELSDGTFGPELVARVPVEGGQPGQLQPMRFIGVDGPRWFLRGLVTGAAATDPLQGRRLFDAFRGTVVHRGGEAMAPREMLPLHLPREAMGHMPPEEPAKRPGLEMLERGPEITETQ